MLQTSVPLDTDIIPPHKAFLVCGLLAGLAFAILNPPFQVPDESAHWWRAIYIANGTIASGPDDTMTASYATVVSRFHKDLKILIDNDRKLKKEHILSLFGAPLIPSAKIPWMILSSDLYNPLPYLPQIPSILIGQCIGLSPIMISYLGRFSNLFAWLLLIYMAIRISPLFKWGFFLLALMPMTLHQAASLSADSTTIAISFFCIAYVLKLGCDGQVTVIARRDCLLLPAIVALAALSKMNVVFLILLFLIPKGKFRNGRAYLFTLSSVFAIVLIGSLSWSYWNSWALETYKNSRAVVVFRENMFFIFQHPIAFASLLLSTLCKNNSDYLLQFAGRLGWLNMELPHWLLYSYLALIGIVAISYSDDAFLSRMQKIVIAIAFAASFLMIFVYLWITEALKDITFIPGVQGRYFIAVSPLFFLLLRRRGMGIPKRMLSLAAIICVATTYCITLPALCARYYGPVVVASISNEIRGCGEAISLDHNTTISQSFIINIPKFIRKSDYEGYLLCKIRNDEDRQLLKSLYHADENNYIYALKENITAQEKQRAQTIFNTVRGFYSTVSKIDILLDPGDKSHVEDVVLHLKKSPDDPEDSATSMLKGTRVQGAGWYTFEFHPVRLKIGRPYSIVLDSPGAQSWNAVGLCASGGDTYRRGRLRINGKPAAVMGTVRPMDLGFRIPIWF